MSIGLAFEAFQYHSQYSHSAEKGKADLFSLSYADYGWKSGVWRLLDLLDEVGLKASMSTNGLAAESHPDAVRTAAEAGHEIVGHGWVNDILMQDDDPEGEVAEIRRCTHALTEAAGCARSAGPVLAAWGRRTRWHSCAPPAISGTATMRATISRSCVTPSTARWS